MRTENLVNKIREIAQPVAVDAGLELVHVELSGSGNKRIVRIYIDKEGGITHEDCAFVSQNVESELDKEDPFSGKYVLEVSSPGIERGLYSLADFERFKGKKARLKTNPAINGQRNFRGVIEDVQNNEIVLEDVASGTVRIDFGVVRKANLEFDIDKELKDGRRKDKKSRAR